MFDKYLIPLYLLDSMNGQIRGRTRFQKLVFLTKQKLKEEGKDIQINFSCLYYGPFSRDLQESLEALTQEGRVNEFVDESSYGLVYVYRLTDQGKKVVKNATKMDLIEKDTRKKIREVSKEFGTVKLNELICKVYDKYPEYNPKLKH